MTGSIWSTAPYSVSIQRLLGHKRKAHTEASGRSPRDFTRKIHVRCDNQGRPLGFVLTGRQVSDYKPTDALMEISASRPQGNADRPEL